MNFVVALVAPYLTRLIIGAVLVIAAGGGFLGLKLHYTHVGYQQAISKIAAEDKETIDAYNQAVDTVHACRNSGGVWDQSERECVRR